MLFSSPASSLIPKKMECDYKILLIFSDVRVNCQHFPARFSSFPNTRTSITVNYVLTYIVDTYLYISNTSAQHSTTICRREKINETRVHASSIKFVIATP
jgi:hypothetical protein